MFVVATGYRNTSFCFPFVDLTVLFKDGDCQSHSLGKQGQTEESKAGVDKSPPSSRRLMTRKDRELLLQGDVLLLEKFVEVIRTGWRDHSEPKEGDAKIALRPSLAKQVDPLSI